MVGFIASITQIVSYVIATKELIQAIYSKVQTGSRELEQRLRQLDRLVETIRAIAKNSLFHTPSIKSHLKAIEPHVESLRIIFGRLRQKKLQTTIGRKLWNAYTEIRAEKQICIIFTKLEEEKSALQLSMSEVSATLLSQVENGVNAIKDGSAQAHDKQEPIHPVDTSQETLWQWPFESHSPTKLDGSQKTGLQGPDEVPIPMEIDFSPETRPQWSNEAPRAMKPQEMKLQKSACPRASTATTEGSQYRFSFSSSEVLSLTERLIQQCNHGIVRNIIGSRSPNAFIRHFIIITHLILGILPPARPHL